MILPETSVSNESTTNNNYFLDNTADLFSPFAMKIFQWIILAVVCQAIAIAGVCTNIVNIICF
ncbi:unnamed protein product, partial [Candidula unifasciata]